MGHRLRINTFVYMLALRICHEIYQQLLLDHQYKDWIKSRFQYSSSLPVIENDAPQANKLLSGWWTDDLQRDKEAADIVKHQRIIITTSCPTFFAASCALSKANIHNSSHIRYVIFIEAQGFCGCMCKDFTTNYFACKHLRALRLILDAWVNNRYIPPLYYPLTR